MQIDPKNGPRLSAAEPIHTERFKQAETDRVRPETTAFLPTASLMGLLARLRGLDEVREEILRQIREQLSKGDVMTPAAAIATAHGILGSDAL
ncbi:MAG: hypothetical protein N2039_08500 [Gemmataceae bacterium]|nr:hypothetical protein [Gemmataceae bacterium]